MWPYLGQHDKSHLGFEVFCVSSANHTHTSLGQVECFLSMLVVEVDLKGTDQSIKMSTFLVVWVYKPGNQ